MRQFNLSQRRACRLVELQRCSFRYCHRRGDETVVRERLKQLAQRHPRWGYRFLALLLRREGHKVNHKRVLRLYREEGLKLRPKRRKKVVSVQRVKPPVTTGINQRWCMDFVSDTLSCGRRFRALSIIDCHSRECLANAWLWKWMSVSVGSVWFDFWSGCGRLVVCLKSFRQTTARSSQAISWMLGLISIESSCSSLSQASRCRMLTSRASTAS